MKNNKGLIFMGMGFELVALVLSALYLGKIIDTHYGTKGIFTIILLLSMLVGWIYHLIHLLMKFEKDLKAEREKLKK